MTDDLLAPGNNVVHLRSTSGESVPATATVVDLLSFPACVAISYERSGHTQLNSDCPVEWLTFPIVRADSSASDHGPSPLPTAVRPHCLPLMSGLQHLRPTVRSVLTSQPAPCHAFSGCHVVGLTLSPLLLSFVNTASHCVPSHRVLTVLLGCPVGYLWGGEVTAMDTGPKAPLPPPPPPPICSTGGQWF